MKKLMLVFVVGILLIGFASAGLFDKKTYDAKEKKIKVEKLFGDDRFTIQLLSDIDEHVGYGMQEVWRKNAIAYEDLGNYKEFVTKEEYFDKNKGMKPRSVKVDIKYLTWSTETYSNYRTVCEAIQEENGTNTYCEDVFVRNITRDVEVWHDIKDLTITKGMNITYAGFTDVKKGDKIEHIYTVGGFRNDEFAVWTADLNTGLVLYYNFTGLGQLTDLSGNDIHGVAEGSPANVSGIQNDAWDFNGVDAAATLPVLSGNFTTTATFCVALNADGNIGEEIFDLGNSSATDSWWNGGSGTNNDVYTDIFRDDRPVTSMINIPTGVWAVYCFTQEPGANGRKSYANGVNYKNETGEPIVNIVPPTGVTIGKSRSGGSYLFFDGQMDELGLWNRVLTQEEITQVSAGITWAEIGGNNPPIVELNLPVDAANISIDSQVISCNVSDGVNLTNVSFLWNGSIEFTNTSGLNDSLYSYTKTGILEGVSNWTCAGTDNSSQTTTPTVRTINFTAPTPLIVQLNTPADASVTSINPETFAANFSNNQGVSNASIMTNETGWGIVKTTYKIGDPAVVYTNLTQKGFLTAEELYFTQDLDGLDVVNYTYWTLLANDPAINLTIKTEFNFVNGSQINISVRDDGTANHILHNLDSPYDDMGVNDLKVWGNGSTVTNTSHVLVNYSVFGYPNNFSSGNVSLSYSFSEALIWNMNICDIDGKCNFSLSNFTLFPDVTAPSVSITNPTTSSSFSTGDNVTLNWTISDTGLSECWYDYNSANTTVTCGDVGIIFPYVSGQDTITMWANDSFSNTGFDTVTWFAGIIINSVTFANPTFVTAENSYNINLSANESLTEVYMLYKDTIHGMTNISQTGNVSLWQKNLTMTTSEIGTNDLNFIFLYAGTNRTSGNFTQTVTGVDFGICNVTLTQKFITFDFKDEADLSVLNASIPSVIFTYFLSNQADNATYAFANVTENAEYSFCATPTTEDFNLIYTLQYASTGYPQRIINPPTEVVSNVTTNKTLYLLASADGIFVTFQVVNQAEAPIEGVDVTVNRTISGETNEIQVGRTATDAAGSATFWLNPDFSHSLSFIKTGFPSKFLTLFPTQSIYTIIMGTPVAPEPDYSQGVSYTVRPIGGFVNNFTTYNFNYTISSDVSTIDEFGFRLEYGNGTVIGTVTDTTNGGTVGLDADTSNQSYINMHYYYFVNSTYNNASTYWLIQGGSGSQYSIWNFFSRFSTYVDSSEGFFGADDLFKRVITLLIVLAAAGGIAMRYGINSESAILGIIFGIVYFLDYGVGFIPDLSFGTIVVSSHFISILVFIILIGMIIKEEIS